MKLNYFQKKLFLINTICLVVANYLMSCSNDFIVIPTATPSPTEINCDVDLSSDISRLNSEPTLIIVLLEANPQYYEYSKQGMSYLLDAISNSAESGDELLVIEMETKEFVDALIVSGSVDDISPPALPPTMTPYPSIEPAATYDQDCLDKRTSFACRNEQDHGTETAVAINVTATYQALMQKCFDQERIKQISTLENDWAIAKATVIADFSGQLQEVATSIPESEERTSRQVYEGLANASLAFKNLCSNYAKCKLIIFSDLDDWRYDKVPPNLSIVLNNVEVLSVMLHCEKIFQPSCKKWQDIFFTEFTVFGAKSTEFINGDKVVEKMIDFIEK